MATNSMLILPYKTSWPNDFLKIKTVLLQTIFASDVMIEHVGSTAVPHLASKPIIDIDIAYINFDTYELLKNGLESLGYYHNGNQGIEGREVFKRKMVTKNHPILDPITHYVFLVTKLMKNTIGTASFEIINKKIKMQEMNTNR